MDCHNRLSVVGSRTCAQISTLVPAWWDARFCAQVEIFTGVLIGTSDMCQTRCCKCTMPCSGSGKRRSAIIAVDNPKAVICTATDGAEFCPTSPDDPISTLYSSTNVRETTSVVSHLVSGSTTSCD